MMRPEGNCKPIKEYEDYYIYDNGTVWSNKSNKFLTPFAPQDYLKVSLLNENGRKDKLIHRLVAEAFIPNPNNYETVNHIDSNKKNNDVSNLEWCDLKTNIQKYYATHKETYVTHKETKQKVNNNFLKINPPRAIIQCDKNTKEEIQVFNSINNAAKSVNASPSNILQVANGKRKSAAGYYWKFTES